VIRREVRKCSARRQLRYDFAQDRFHSYPCGLRTAPRGVEGAEGGERCPFWPVPATRTWPQQVASNHTSRWHRYPWASFLRPSSPMATADLRLGSFSPWSRANYHQALSISLIYGLLSFLDYRV
jgi:hypothetical protein